jgi:hypothetical protein
VAERGSGISEAAGLGEEVAALPRLPIGDEKVTKFPALASYVD